MRGSILLLGLFTLVGCQPWQEDVNRNDMRVQDLEVRVKLLESQLEDIQQELSSRSANKEAVVTLEIPTSDLVKIYRKNDEAFNQAFRQYMEQQQTSEQ